MSLPSGIEAAAGGSELVRDALAMARDVHRGQIRNASGGMDYVEHPIAVAELLAIGGWGEEELAAALLHDVVEDSEVELEEIDERFGGAVHDLVAALTDDEGIEPYEARKDEHRRRVRRAGHDALAIYAADKLTNVRALRHAYVRQGESVASELKVPLDTKIGVWRADLETLRAAGDNLPFTADLEAELNGLDADRAKAAQLSH
jgi:GTP pyrophosphokinase